MTPPYQPPPQGSWAVPPDPRRPGAPHRRPVRVGRVFAGLGIAMAAHLLTLVVALVGVAGGNDDVIWAGLWIGLAGQLLVFLGCLIAGIILTVRQDGGIGIGLLIGWAVGVLIIPVIGFGLCVAAFEAYN
jgi:hypothetical protein